MEFVSKLQQARVARRWTVGYVAECIGVQRSTVSRWENGHEQPRPSYVAALEKLYGMSAVELGLEEALLPPSQKKAGVRLWSDRLAVAVSQDLLSRLYARIALSGMTYQDLTCLRVSIGQELERPETMKDGLSRRETIRFLAMLPVITFNLSAKEALTLASAPLEEILKHCAAGIAACEQLVKGDGADLSLAASTLAHYVPTLEAMVEMPGKYHKQAASLVAQVYMREAQLAVHLQSSKQAVSYAQKAVAYAKESGDVALNIATLMRLSWTHFNNKDYKRASEKALQAQYLAKQTQVPLSAWLQSDIYMVSARYQALIGMPDEVEGLLAAGQSFHEQALADEGETLCAYVDCSDDIFTLLEGQAHFFARKPEAALNTLGKVIDLDNADFALLKPVASQRMHVEILNYAALSWLKLPQQKKDKKRSLALTSRGLDGAEALASRPRYDESDRAIDIMESLWPDDRDVIALRERAIAIKTKLWGNGKKKAEE